MTSVVIVVVMCIMIVMVVMVVMSIAVIVAIMVSIMMLWTLSMVYWSLIMVVPMMSVMSSMVVSFVHLLTVLCAIAIAVAYILSVCRVECCGADDYRHQCYHKSDWLHNDIYLKVMLSSSNLVLLLVFNCYAKSVPKLFVDALQHVFFFPLLFHIFAPLTKEGRNELSGFFE